MAGSFRTQGIFHMLGSFLCTVSRFPSSPVPEFKFVPPGDDSMSKRSSVGRFSKSRMARGRKDEKMSRQRQERASTYNSWLESDLGLGLGGWADLEERFFDELRRVTEKQRKGGNCEWKEEQGVFARGKSRGASIAEPVSRNVPICGLLD